MEERVIEDLRKIIEKNYNLALDLETVIELAKLLDGIIELLKLQGEI